MPQLIENSRLFLFALLVALPALVPVQASDNIEHITDVEGISEYRLDNGLKVLLMPDGSRSTTTVNITYFVGSKHESYGETGMAHLLEHMLFQGTANHPDITAEIAERGGRANGTTWYERTNYFQTLPADGDNLEWALRMEADRMVNSLIRGEDLESEMTVVRNEFEIGETNPIGVLMQRVMSTAHLWHGYGRSTIGARSDIENVPLERLHNFYRRYYQPDNAVLILSGNLESDEALRLVEKHFGAIPAPERSGEMKLWPTYTRDPEQDGERNVTVRRSGSFQALMAAWHVPAAAHPDFPAIEVLAHILGEAPSGRLHQALVTTGLATQVGSFSQVMPEPSTLLAYALVDRDDDLDTARRTMLDSIAELAEKPPTEEEVRRAVNALKRNVEVALNDSNRIGIELSEWAAAGDWRLMFLNRDRLEKVTPDDVIRVANTYLKRDNRTLGQFIPDDKPERAGIPEAPDTDTLLAGYEGRSDRQLGESFNPTPENIEERLVRFELPGGAKVALLPKKTRGGRVKGQISMRLGTLDTLTGLGGIPGATAGMLMRGSENHSRQDIRDRISELGSTLSIGGGDIVAARLETTDKHLDELLDLIADVLKNPVFDDSELSEYRRQQLIQLDATRDDPMGVASHLLSRHTNRHPADHPDYVPDWDERERRIRSLSRDQLADFHRMFYGFGKGTTISFVGDFDAQELRARLESLFADYRPSIAFERHEVTYHSIEPAAVVEQMNDKANAGLVGSLQIPMRDDHPDYPALSMASHLMGGGFLSSRLANRIRNEEGLSYGVGAMFNANSIDERATFFTFAMFAPENRDRLVETLFEELNDAVDNGFGDEELDQGRRGFLQQLELGRSDDDQLVATLNSNLYLERDMYHQADFEKAIKGLTAEEVSSALRRHINPDRLSYVTAGDFEQGDDSASSGEADN